MFHLAKEEPRKTTCSEEVDELFVTTFNIIRDASTSAINKICDFIGNLIQSFSVCNHMSTSLLDYLL